MASDFKAPQQSMHDMTRNGKFSGWTHVARKHPQDSQPGGANDRPDFLLDVFF
jgi:hypothetical protein